jgi:putative transposase
MLIVIGLWTFLRVMFCGSATIALENLALRHQLAVLQRSDLRPRLSRWDRILCVWLSHLWTSWRSSLVIVQPATVLAWHRQGFQLYWRWRSTATRPGRPRLDAEIRHLIRRMARDNPTWGPRRIQAELARLGYEVAELTIAKYMHRTATHPSPTWRVFLASHARDIAAVDFFLLPTLTDRLLFAFVVLRHHRRELLHLHVSDQPTAVWTVRQILEAFPKRDRAKIYLLRDRDAIYGERFTRCLANMGICDVIIAPRAPWQNAFAKRVIGSIRRECLDHVIILSEADLCRVLRAYLAYYNTARPHQSLHNNSPHPRVVQPPFPRSTGSITATSAPPDHRDRDPPVARSWVPRVPPAVWRSTIMSALRLLLRPFPSRSGDPAFGLDGRTQRGTTAIRPPMRFLTGTGS